MNTLRDAEQRAKSLSSRKKPCSLLFQRFMKLDRQFLLSLFLPSSSVISLLPAPLHPKLELKTGKREREVLLYAVIAPFRLKELLGAVCLNAPLSGLCSLSASGACAPGTCYFSRSLTDPDLVLWRSCGSASSLVKSGQWTSAEGAGVGQGFDVVPQLNPLCGPLSAPAG